MYTIAPFKIEHKSSLEKLVYLYTQLKVSLNVGYHNIPYKGTHAPNKLIALRLRVQSCQISWVHETWLK